MRSHHRFVGAVLLPVFLLSGCASGWSRVALPTPPVSEREALQVFHGRKVEEWHAVRITADSISGVSLYRSPDCADCRQALPLSQVDSVRQDLGGPSAGAAVGAGFLFIGGIFLVVFLKCKLTNNQTCFVS